MHESFQCAAREYHEAPVIKFIGDERYQSAICIIRYGNYNEICHNRDLLNLVLGGTRACTRFDLGGLK